MKTYIKLLRTPTEEDKLGPQVKAIMVALGRALGADDKDSKVGQQAERTKVIEQLTAGSELVTRQDPARILSFYQPQLADKGIIEIVKVNEPKPEKPAKEKTTAKGPAAGAAPKAAGTGEAPKPAAAPAAGATA